MVELATLLPAGRRLLLDLWELPAYRHAAHCGHVGQLSYTVNYSRRLTKICDEDGGDVADAAQQLQAVVEALRATPPGLRKTRWRYAEYQESNRVRVRAPGTGARRLDTAPQDTVSHRQNTSSTPRAPAPKRIHSILRQLIRRLWTSTSKKSLQHSTLHEYLSLNFRQNNPTMIQILFRQNNDTSR